MITDILSRDQYEAPSRLQYQINTLKIKIFWRIISQCVKEGVEYNWSLYLLNQFIEDCRPAQETVQPLRYSWLLIIIVFVGWKEPRDSQFLTILTDFRGVRYANLWASRNPEHENLSNMVFYTYYQMLCEAIQKMPHITNEVTEQ